jgi:NAD(P)-dependent dehydrogenase (short-subunit alcohol dehydrogenase family)
MSVLDGLPSQSAGVVVGDLRSAAETRTLAEQVNVIGRMDAVIHNAGILTTKDRSPTPEGHASILAVNTPATSSRPRSIVRADSCTSVAACIATVRVRCATSTGASGAGTPVRRMQTASCISLHSRSRSRDVLSNAVDPGWVPTKMGGPGAPDDLEEGHFTQSWLAVSDESAATVGGGYWHHRRSQAPAKRSLILVSRTRSRPSLRS